MMVNQYPLGSRVLNTQIDSVLGLVTGQLCNIPLETIFNLIPSFAFSGGTTAQRPVVPVLYQMYFDTSFGMPVWCKQVSPAIWVNAAGVQT